MYFSSRDNQKVAFIVRASSQDGLGHLIRSLSVAHEMKKLAKVHLFLVGDQSGQHLVEDTGLSWTYSKSDKDCLENIFSYSPGVIIFDTLNFEESLFHKLNNTSLTISLSPIFSSLSEVDHLFHRTSCISQDWNLENFPFIHKGLEYAILPPGLKRVSSKNYKDNLKERKLSIGISMGGSDSPNRTLQLLKLLSNHHQELVLWVALGEAYNHSYEELLQCANKNKQEIILLKSNESMWRVLKNSSLVICSGGLTTYEATYVGLPSINILHHSEWHYLFEELEKKNVCYTYNPAPNAIQLAVDLVLDLASDRDRLMNMHLLSKDMIVSGGSKRIAKKIFQLTGE